jgi:hypothetical protein
MARSLGNKTIENSCLANLGQTHAAVGRLDLALRLPASRVNRKKYQTTRPSIYLVVP